MMRIILDREITVQGVIIRNVILNKTENILQISM